MKNAKGQRAQTPRCRTEKENRAFSEFSFCLFAILFAHSLPTTDR